MEPFRMTPPFRPRADISTEDVDARSHISRYRLLIHLSIQPPSRREARSPLRTMYVETLVFATYFLFIRSFALTDCDDRSHWGPMVEGGESDIPCRHYQPHFFLFYGYPFFFLSTALFGPILFAVLRDRFREYYTYTSSLRTLVLLKHCDVRS